MSPGAGNGRTAGSETTEGKRNDGSGFMGGFIRDKATRKKGNRGYFGE